MTLIRAATRGSSLARLQTELVGALLGPSVSFELVVVETAGDRRVELPIAQLGGQGVFVKEVQQAVLEGRADIAVHSAKDLPSRGPEGLVIAAVPEREDPRDALVGALLEEIPVGGRVGTGSVRRRAQLAAVRPDLTFAELRGNIDTRLRKASDFDAIAVAVAALRRLGYSNRIAEVLEIAVMLPQVGQGALAVECRADDEATKELVSHIEHRPSRLALDAERAFLAAVGGSCSLPVAALATVGPGDGLGHLPMITLEALLAHPDGHVVLRAEQAGEDPAALGSELAHHLLVTAGGAELAEDVPLLGP